MEQYRAFKEQWSVNTFVKRYEKGEINFKRVKPEIPLALGGG